MGSDDKQSATMATTTPSSVPATAAAATATATESYRTGFVNPMFEETVKTRHLRL